MGTTKFFLDTFSIHTSLSAKLLARDPKISNRTHSELETNNGQANQIC